MFALGRNRGRVAVFVAAAAVAAIALSGCTASNTGGSTATGVTVYDSNAAFTENFNPLSPTSLQMTKGAIYEPLFFYNSMSSNPKPSPILGTSFKWNSDGTELTVTTRQGVKWSDGKPFTANDVAFTFNLMNKTPALNSAGLAATATATNDDTVVLHFKQTSFTQEANALGQTAIIPEHIWKSVTNPTTFVNKNPIGTGPFTLKSFTPQSYVLEKNTKYWEPGKPQIDTVRQVVLSDNDAQIGAVLDGTLDWMTGYLPKEQQQIAGKKNLSLVNTNPETVALFSCSSSAMGCTGPQTDPAVRQALYYAIDRPQLNKLAENGLGGKASPTLLLPDVSKSWIADPSATFVPQSADVAKADSILATAGYTKGADGIYQKNGQPVSMTVQVVTGWSDIISDASILTTQLKAAGIELKTTQLAQNEWSNNETQGTYQLSIDNVGPGASTNPYDIYQKWYNGANTAKVGQPASGGNYARYDNPAVNTALSVAGATNDPTTQKAQYAIIQKDIAKDLPYIPLYLATTPMIFNDSKVTGWPTEKNLYAFPASWKAFDNGIVLKNLKPVK
jgi:peptide/nickel transport system substrate-binding protein